MAVIVGETHIPECVTGKPIGVGGLPGRLEATGYGVTTIARLAAQQILKKDPHSLSVAIQGFGNVGSFTAAFCHELGFKITAVSDIGGAVANPAGLDVPRLLRHVKDHRTVAGFPGEKIRHDALLEMPVDLLIPAAAGDVITARNAGAVRARCIVEAANNPVTPDADAVLNQRGVPVVPDILANAGGVCGSYVEWHHSKSGAMATKEDVLQRIDSVLTNAWTRTLAARSEFKCDLRSAALVVAAGELLEAMRDRNWI
jgi:glutamate dehydrogenase/leucine dehydrogenase